MRIEKYFLVLIFFCNFAKCQFGLRLNIIENKFSFCIWLAPTLQSYINKIVNCAL